MELLQEPSAAGLERQRVEMDQLLDEIKAWLALEQGRRAPLHDWMARFHKPEVVYREMMSDADRSRLLQWLNRSLDGSAESSAQWTSASTGLRFAATLDNRVGGQLGQGYLVGLTVDLNPILGLHNNPRYLGKTSLGLYRNEQGAWNLR
jgi:hypothetical protein